MTNIDIKERYNKSPALDVLDDIKNINLKNLKLSLIWYNFVNKTRRFK